MRAHMAHMPEHTAHARPSARLGQLMGFSGRARGGEALRVSSSQRVVRAVLAIVIAAFMCMGATMSAPGLSVSEAFAADSSQPHVNTPVSGALYEDAAEVDLPNGLYHIDVTLGGGSGRASVSSPAELDVYEGRALLTLVWSSSHYDYVVLGDKKYLPEKTAGDSTFIVPVTAYDEPIPLIGDTTAMSQPHEVDYTLTVVRASAQQIEAEPASADQSASVAQGASATEAADSASKGSSASSATAASSDTGDEAASSSASQIADSSAQDSGLTWPWVVFIVCVIASAVCIGVTVGIVRGYQNR